MSEDLAIWQIELARVEGVAKVHFAALARRVAALEASMTDDSRPPNNDQSAAQPESRPADDEGLSQWLTEISRAGEDTRPDALIGEIVRFLVRADKAAFAKIYALVKTEAEKMDARSNERFRAMYRRSPKANDSSSTETKENP